MMSVSKQALGVGDAMPDIVLPDVDGRLVRFSEFRGKRLFVFMWASW